MSGTLAPLAHVGSGTYSLSQLLPLATAAALYAARAITLARQGRPVPRARMLAFAGGVVVILLSLASPVAHLGGELFAAHMVQHLLLGDFGALLLVVGLTGPIIGPLLRLPVIGRLRVIAHPAPAFALWAANLYLWHLPVLYQGTLTSEPLHALMHAGFVTTGMLVWMPLFGPLPRPEWFGDLAKLVYIIAMRLTGTVLANVFIWSGTIFYPSYAPGRALWGLSPLEDQGVAGSVMMIEESILMLCLFGWLFLGAARRSEEQQRLLEVAAANGIALDPQRARRAVRAGRAGELERRLLSGAASEGARTGRASRLPGG